MLSLGVNRRDFLALVLLSSLPALFFWPVLLFNKTFYLMDITSLHYPLKVFAGDILRQGQIPLWNPYVFFGFPLLAEGQTGVFYPLNLFFLLPIPSHFALTCYILVHFSLAGIFTYLLARSLGISRTGSLVSALSFAYSGYLMAQLTNLNIVTGSIWLPLILLFFIQAIRKNSFSHAVLSGAVLAIQILTSHSQIVFYSAVAVTIYWLYALMNLFFKTSEGILTKKSIKLLALMLVTATVAASLLAFQLLPTYELSRLSVRSEGLDYERMIQHSLPPSHLVIFIFPNFFGNPVTGYTGEPNFFELHAYNALLPLMLSILAWRKRTDKNAFFFIALAAISVPLALGGSTPLYHFLQYVPGFNFFRAPARWLFTVSFSLAILAGYGFDVLVKERERPWIATFAKAMISSTIVAVLVSPLILFVKNGEPFVYKILNLHSDTAPQAIKALVERLGHLSVPSHPNTLGWFTSLMLNPLLFFLVIGTASVLVIHLFLGKRINLLTLNAVAVILIVIDLFLSGGTNINPVRDYSFWEKRESTAFLEENVGTYRIQPGGDNPVQGLWHNLVTLYRIQSVSKTEPGLLLRRNEEFSDYLSGGPTFYDWAGVKYILTEEEMDDQSLREVYRENQFRIYENTDVLPRAFVVHHAEVAETPTAALRRLAYPDFDPLSVVVLEEEAPFHEDAITSRFQPSKAQIVSYTPNQVIIEATTDHDGYLFLSDTWYPGWKAYVDGREEKIYRANYVFRAVPIQEGRHLVEFVYDPLSFKIGVIISLLTLSLLFTLIIFKPKILQP